MPPSLAHFERRFFPSRSHSALRLPDRALALAGTISAPAGPMKYRAAAAAVALLIASCDCGGSTLTILRGRLEVSPKEIDFGTVAVGETARRTIAASNSGGAPIESIELRVAAPFSLSEPPEQIDAGESISILVAFRASGEGAWSDALAIESDSGSASIDLSAEALGPDIGEPIDTPDDPNIDAPDVVPEEAG